MKLFIFSVVVVLFLTGFNGCEQPSQTLDFSTTIDAQANTSYLLRITNQSGDLIYEQEKSEQTDFFWNGKDMSDNAVDAGTYRYAIYSSTQTGDIAIAR
jgi:flagellar hook assembly protein FlgD